MKKVKVFLTAIIMVVASAVFTACSCSETEFTPVYETGISIECTSSNVESSRNEQSGNLTIECYKGETFTIRYTLTPASATTTQVDWEFSTPNIVESSTYSYSKSVQESITFSARNKGKTKITFTTHTTGKKVEANITVFEEKSKLPTLATPKDFSYDANNGSVSWGAIESEGLSEYEVVIQEYTIGSDDTPELDTSVEPIVARVTTNSYEGLESGKTYGIRVTAIGDDQEAKTGEQSKEFKFHQLAEATVDSVQNGVVAVVSSRYCARMAVICDGIEGKKLLPEQTSTSISELGGVTRSFSCLEDLGEDVSKYDMSVIAYPKDYQEDSSTKNGVCYYPSKGVTIPTITRLSSTTLSLTNVAGTEEIGGVTFKTASKETKLNLQGKDAYRGINVKYQYFIFYKESIDGNESEALEAINPTDSNKEVNFGNDKVNVVITNDVQMGFEDIKDRIASSGIAYVYVRMVGNLSSTISGEWEKVKIKQLGRVMDRDGGNNDICETAVSDNIVMVSASSSYIDRVEFYFVNKENSSNSRVVLATNENIYQYNIASLDLPSGSYDVYAKLIGKETGEGQLVGGLTGSLYKDNPIATVKVLKAVEGIEMSSDGMVEFSAVSYQNAKGNSEKIGNYTVNLKMGNNQGKEVEYSMPLNVNAEWDVTQLNGVYVTPLTQNDNKYSFNLFDVLRAIVAMDNNLSSLPSKIEESYIDALLKGKDNYDNYVITIIANSNGEGEEAVISSKSSAEMKFGRVNAIESFSLEDGKLTFARVNASAYVVVINGVSSEEYRSSLSSNITIDLARLKTADGTKYMLDCIDMSAETTTVEIYGKGRTSSTSDTNGMLDSIKTLQYVSFSNTPTSLSMSDEGVFSWHASAKASSEAVYIVKLFNATTNTLLDTQKVYYRNGEKVNDDTRKYTLDISGTLSNNEGTKLYMIVSESVPGYFAKSDSTSFYVMKLTTVNVSRTVSGGENSISWDGVDGAQGYTLTCSSAIFTGDEGNSDYIRISDTSYQIPKDLGLGNYTFTVVAYSSNQATSGHSADAPYIISSSSEKTGDNNPITNIIVSDGTTRASARGENVIWNYNSQYTYTVSYKGDNESTWSSVSEEDITTTEGILEKSFSLATANADSYTIKIITTVDYVTTGVILSGSECSTPSVVKLVTPSSVTTDAGRLKVMLPEALVGYGEDLVFEIYNNGTLMDGSLYTLTGGGDLYYVDFGNVPTSKLKITIRVKVQGKINSNSTESYEVTKIATVGGFERSGDYLQWSPVEFATGYIITVDKTEKSYKLKVVYNDESKTYSCQIIGDDGSAEKDADIFCYESGVLKFKPDTLVAGAHTYTVSAITETNTYLNGNGISISVTKLHNDVDVSVGLGVFEYGNYEVAEGQERPVQVEITVYRLKEKTTAGENENTEEGETSEGAEQGISLASANGYEIDNAYEAIKKIISFEEYAEYIALNGKYILDISGEERYNEKAQYGTTIRFIGNNANIISSDETALCSAPKISPVEIGTTDGQISWSGPNGATYSVEISDSTGIVVTFDITSDKDTITLPAGFCEGVDGVENLKGFGADSNEDIELLASDTTFNYIAGVEYSIRVSTRSQGNLKSEWSKSFSFKKLLAISELNMKVQDGDPILKWTNSNADTYKDSKTYKGNGIAIGYYPIDEGDEISLTDVTWDASYRALSYDIPVGEYYIIMQAKGNTSKEFGLLNSDPSATGNNCKVKYIASDTMPEVNNGKLSWLPYDSAYSYKVVFTKDKDTSPYTAYTSENELDLNDSSLGEVIRQISGYWDIQVIALTDPTQAMVSTHKSTKSDNQTYTYRPGELKSFKVKDGKLSWTIDYEEIESYMDRIDEPDIDTGDDGDEEISTQSESSSKFGDASSLIPHIKDMATKGTSTETIYESINLQHFYKVKLNMSGNEIEISATEARTLDSSGQIVDDDTSGAKIEFSYEVELESSNGGYYDFSITALGNENVLDGVCSGSLKAYKLATPISWYDKKQVASGSEETEAGDDEESKAEETVKDIQNGDALWQLVKVIGTKGEERYNKYTLTASPNNSGASSVVKVDCATMGSLYDEYKYSIDLKDLFYGDGKDTTIQLDTIYNLYLQANGTEDSDKELSGIFYLNSNKYTFGDTMTILKACDPEIKSGWYNWSPNDNSQASQLVIYGPLNYKDADPTKELIENENWATNTDTLTMLAKLRYSYTGSDKVFEECGITDEITINKLKEEVANNRAVYGKFGNAGDEDSSESKYIKIVNLEVRDGARTSQYTLTDNDYAKGGYAIYEQEIGNGRGIVDSPESEVDFAYKLGTTSTDGTIEETKNGTTKKVEYWLGSGDTAGMFTWKVVPLANAYRLTLSAVDTSVEGAEKQVLESNIIVKTNYYDLPNKDFNNSNYEYSLDIVAIRIADIHDGKESTANEQMVDGYFASDRVLTDKEVSFGEGEDNILYSGRYLRLAQPNKLKIDDQGKISWNDGAEIASVANYKIQYQWSDIETRDIGKTPEVEVLDTILGKTAIRVRAIADKDAKYLNSCYSSDLQVNKIAPPNPAVTEGVFGWATDGDNAYKESVTNSQLTIDDGSAMSLDSTVLQYKYFTEVTEDNYTTYQSKDDEDKFKAGNHKFEIMYEGSSGTSEENKTFYIASEKLLYYLVKLATPTLEHYKEGDNKIRWNEIENAQAYKLKFFVVVEGKVRVYTYTINMVNGSITIENPSWINSTEIKVDLSKEDNDYFTRKDGNIIFKLDNLFGNNGVGSEISSKGLDIKVFVQAMGTLASSTTSENSESTRDYLNSSYSDGVPVSIPSAPTGAQYDPITGTLSWTMINENDANNNYNVLIVAEYKVSGLDEETKNIWIKTAEMTGTCGDTPNFTAIGTNTEKDINVTKDSDIKERVVVVGNNASAVDGKYTIYVRDTILVKSINNKMPLSYKLKSVATDYSFKLTTTAYMDAKEDGKYKSSEYSYSGDGTNIEFALFDSGNGTSALPYQISTEAGLNSIREYPDRYFKMTSDIALINEKDGCTWNIIDEFGGTLDGQDHLISNIKAKPIASEDNKSSYMSFINTNSGNIKNIRLQIDYSTPNTKVNEYIVAGLAIANKGTIDNVHIVPYLQESNGKIDYVTSDNYRSKISVTATCESAWVGGLVALNSGTISNCSVLADITVLVDKISDLTESPNGYVGGIVCKTPSGASGVAVIKNSCFKSHMKDGELFSGSITANYIGGILERNEAETKVEGCYVDKGVVLTITDATYKDTNYKTSGNLGAIVGYISENITIDTCYSLASIRIDIKGNSNGRPFAIGGIVGDFIRTNPNLSISISDCYAWIDCCKVADSRDAKIKLYAIAIKDEGNNATNMEASGCYYVVSSSNVIAIDESTVGEKVDTLDTLKEKVSSQKYDTSGTYPTVKKSND